MTDILIVLAHVEGEGDGEMNMYESNKREKERDRERLAEKRGHNEAQRNKTAARSAFKPLPPSSDCNPENRATAGPQPPHYTHLCVITELTASGGGSIMVHCHISVIGYKKRFIFRATETCLVYSRHCILQSVLIIL